MHYRDEGGASHLAQYGVVEDGATVKPDLGDEVCVPGG